MKAKDLRNSILQLAVQGKLVEQDPADEPASALIERIRAERARLIAEKKIRAPKGGESIIYRDARGSYYEKRGGGEPVCIDDEIPFEIPESWEWVRLASVADVQLGKMLDKEKNQGSPKPYLGNINVQWKHFDLEKVKTMLFRDDELEKFRLLPGDLMVCEGGVPGRCAIWNSTEEMYYQKALHRVRCLENVLNVEYCQIVLDLIVNSHVLDDEFTGTTIKHLPARVLEQWKIPLPPICEQKRIVVRVGELLSIIDDYSVLEEARERLDAEFPVKLRKSVLQYAMQGKLVEQRPEEGTGEELYAQIQKEKAKLLEQGKIKREKPLPVITNEEMPFDIPDSWRWVRFGEVVDFRIGKTPPRTDSQSWGNDYRWIAISDMVSGGHVSETKEGISRHGFQHVFGERITPKGTLIMSFKLTIGCVSLLDIDALHNEAIISIFPILDENVAMRDYLFKVMPYISKTGDSKKAIKGSTLNSKSLKNLLIPLPPLKEQRRIVKKLDQILPHIEGLKEVQ